MSTMAQLAQDDIACVGVRGIQGMRRSRSSSAVSRARPARGKVRSAKEYLNKHGVETDLFALKLLKCSASFGIDVQIPAFSNKLKPLPVQQLARLPKAAAVSLLPAAATEGSWSFYSNDVQSYEDLFNLSMGESEDFDGKSNKILELNYIAEIKNQAGRRSFFCNEVMSYEQFYNMVGDDQELFDDQLQVAEMKKWSSRHFYCKEIFSYEELFNIMGDDQATFDDQHIQIFEEATKSIEGSRQFYGKEIQSYEEFFNIVGGDDEVFDDEIMKPSRCYFGKEIESYEEFYNMVGGCELFDDEYLKIRQPRHFYGKEIQSYEELFNLTGSHEQFDDECVC